MVMMKNLVKMKTNFHNVMISSSLFQISEFHQ